MLVPGWSPRGGQTMGAFYPESSPAGSSSGSAVAVALGLAATVLGTEVGDPHHALQSELT